MPSRSTRLGAISARPAENNPAANVRCIKAATIISRRPLAKKAERYWRKEASFGLRLRIIDLLCISFADNRLLLFTTKRSSIYTLEKNYYNASITRVSVVVTRPFFRTPDNEREIAK